MTDPQDWNPEEEALHRALHEAADEIMPAAGGLAAIRQRTSRAAWWRRPVMVGVGVASATAVGVVAVALVVTQPDNGTPVGSATISDEPSATPSPSSTPSPDETSGTADSTPPTTTTPPETQTEAQTAEPEAELTTLPVYFAVETSPGEPRLVREWHEVETAEPVADAVRAMLDTAQDSDYRTLWLASTRVRSAEVQDDVIVVDLDTPGLSTESPEADAAAIQQLVYTATAAASVAEEAEGALPVQILENGETITALGNADVSETQERAKDIDVLQRVWIDEPFDRSTISNPVTVHGSAAVFEATVDWEVRDGAGDVVAEDFATAEIAAPEFGEYSFEVPELDPGTYEVEVREPDVSGGEGDPPPSDTKTFTVTD